MEPFDDKPGSPRAVNNGCTCSPTLNCNGEGVPSDHGPIHHAEPNCPLHGVEFLKTKLSNGVVFTGEPSDP
jgi:hypothetical protein